MISDRARCNICIYPPPPKHTKTKRYFPSSKSPGRLQEALSLLATGTGDFFLLEAGSWGAKLTTYLYPGKAQ